MAIYDLGTASLAANGEVTGVGTTWKAPLTLIRVGATIVFKTEPVKIYTISEIISDTQINVYNPNSETVPAGTGYAILAHDGITVQGLAQDVAETLRYYQSRETEVADAVDAFNNFDSADFESKVSQVNTQHGDVVSISAQVSSDAAQVSSDKNSAAESALSASNDKDAAAISAQEAANYAASIDTSKLVTKKEVEVISVKPIIVGSLIEAPDQYVSYGGKTYILSTASQYPVTISSIDGFSINNGAIELTPIEYRADLIGGRKVARNDAQLVRMMVAGGSILVEYSPVTVNQIVNITKDVSLSTSFPIVDVVTSQFWIRGPRTYNSETQEFDYADVDVSVVGNFRFDFSSQSSEVNPGVGIAIQSGGNQVFKGCELFGGWVHNLNMSYGKYVEISDVYSHDCGRGQVQLADGSNRQGSAVLVDNANSVNIYNVRTYNTWASSLFIDSYTAGRTESLRLDNIEINKSQGNGLRIQSDDLVRGTGGGDAIVRVVATGISIRDCASHALRCNAKRCNFNGVLLESSNAGLSIESAADSVFSSFNIINCSQGVLCRYYPVEVSRIAFSDFNIIGSTNEAVYFLRGATNTTTPLGSVSFADFNINGNGVSTSKAMVINGGGGGDIKLSNIAIANVVPIASGGYYNQIVNFSTVEARGFSFRGVLGNAEAYIQTMASVSCIIDSFTSFNFSASGTIVRPVAIGSPAPTYSSVTNCIIPGTRSSSVGYPIPLPTNRYESSNQFANSLGAYTYTTPGASTSRSLSVSTATATDVANVLSTLISDLHLGRYVTK